ncbi:MULTISPECIES: glycosyltransferase family 4 protein [unclassified Minwuia]|uniref:glycosyltransferase family 4 protein n=1 Tax=unclassified Minwuia TaxID=2618799 RepID=UPI002479E5B7|nr:MULTISPECIES: glycosyltransferase family 4 protein [unclassified Minwuia]
MSTAPPATGRVAFVLKGYPRLSETFIAQEILALEQRGLAIDIWSLRHPTDTTSHPVHQDIAAPVSYLPEYLRDEPARVRQAWRTCSAWPTWQAATALFGRDYRRDPTVNRVRRFGQAVVLAAELPPSVTRLHAHFLHTPASTTRYAALLKGLPWSVSAHAKDIWTSPAWEKREKLADCAFAVTCTAANADHLAELAPEGRVSLVYHGLDLTRFPPAPATRPANPVPVILSVGRAVTKKGYPVLLKALAEIGLPWRFIHIGGGEQLAELKQQAEALGIADRIDWRGPQPQQAVLEACRQADLFVLASRIADDGDRDGLPNVLMEAQSQGLPVVATAVSAIPELVRDGETGLLVPPDDPQALAAALSRMLRDPAARKAMGQAGEARVRSAFDLDRCIDRLAAKFGLEARE